MSAHRPWGRSGEGSTAALALERRRGPRHPSLPLVPLPQDTALRNLAHSEAHWAPARNPTIYTIRLGPSAPSGHHRSPGLVSWLLARPPRSGLYSSPSDPIRNKSHHAPPLHPTHSGPVGSALLLPIFISYPPSLPSVHGAWLLLHRPGQVPDPGPSLALLSTWDSPGTGSQEPASFAPSPATSLCSRAILPSDGRPGRARPALVHAPRPQHPVSSTQCSSQAYPAPFSLISLPCRDVCSALFCSTV